MPAFFAHKRGTVVRVASLDQQAGGARPFRIIMTDMDMSAPDTRAIVTQVGIVENGNFQFLHTLNETIYAYVFGDRIGELRVSGICFAHSCDDRPSGMKQIVDNYRAKRLSKSGGPVQVSIGDINYKAALVGMNLDVLDAETSLGQWTFSFKTFPGNQ